MPRISQKFIDRKVRRPDHGQVIYRDDELIGFELRVTRGSMSYPRRRVPSEWYQSQNYNRAAQLKLMGADMSDLF